jgi:hypothetical protein
MYCSLYIYTVFIFALYISMYFLPAISSLKPYSSFLTEPGKKRMYEYVYCINNTVCTMFDFILVNILTA